MKAELPWWLNGKELIYQCRRCRFNPWVGKIPWRIKWPPTPVFLPGKSHGQRSLVGYSPWGRKESDRTEHKTLSLSHHKLMGGSGNSGGTPGWTTSSPRNSTPSSTKLSYRLNDYCRLLGGREPGVPGGTERSQPSHIKDWDDIKPKVIKKGSGRVKFTDMINSETEGRKL